MENSAYPDLNKLPLISWWQQLFLWFVPTRKIKDDESGMVYCFKIWRGKVYVWDIENSAAPGEEGK